MKNQEMVKFRQLVPGILSIMIRLPIIIAAALKAAGAREPIGSVIEKSAVKFADNAAVLFEERMYTYHEFNEAVNRYANYFISRGTKKGDVAVVLLGNRPELLMIIGALAKIGAVSSLVNPRHVGHSLVHSINISKANLHIIGEEAAGSYEAVRDRLDRSTVRIPYYVSDEDKGLAPDGYIDLNREIKNCSPINPDVGKAITIRDPYAYIFTSGTTGLPKAAILSHQRWVFSAYLMADAILYLKANDTLYVSIPLYHAVGNLMGWAAAFGCGAGLAISRKFSAGRFWDEVRKFHATAFVYVGEICRYLMNQPAKRNDADNSIRTIIGNGLRPEICTEFKKRFGISRVVEFYGATEGTAGFLNVLNVDGTVGISFLKSRIVKYDTYLDEPVRNDEGLMIKCSKGEAGLLLGRIEGQIPFDGYTDEAATRAKIIRDVFKKGDAWFNTGDLIKSVGYGHARFVDRIGDTFRWKSENVSTSEVEKSLNQISGILESAVYGVKIPGTEGRAGMAAIRTDQGDQDFNFAQFRTLLEESLPPYAVPVFIRFIDEMQTTDTHKIIKADFQNDRFNPLIITDPVYVLLPGSSGYTRLTRDLYEKVMSGEFRF